MTTPASGRSVSLMEATYAETPPELVFPAQAAFSWTLRSARARRAKASKLALRTSSYRITGSAAGSGELAAAIAFCKEHGAILEWE